MQTIATSPTSRRGVLIENLMAANVTLDAWKYQLRHIDADKVAGSQKDIIVKLIDEIDGMRKEGEANYYHGGINIASILVSEDELSLTDNGSLDTVELSLTIEPQPISLYLPEDLRRARLDPTVDELAFVRTVQQVAQLWSDLRMERDRTPLLDLINGRGTLFLEPGKGRNSGIPCLDLKGAKETHLSQFLSDVSIDLDSGLKYVQDEDVQDEDLQDEDLQDEEKIKKFKKKFKENRTVVYEAIQRHFPYRMCTDVEEERRLKLEVVKFRTVYSAVKRILDHEKWNEELEK